MTPLSEDIDMGELQSFDDVFMSQPDNRSQDIADLFKWSYALHLKSIMSTVVKKYCNGCYNDHPSQTEHDVCMMLTFEEQVNKWFDEALEMVDEDYIIGHWFGTLGQLHPRVHYHEISKYFDPMYRLECINVEWMLDVKNKLLSLEYHPY